MLFPTYYLNQVDCSMHSAEKPKILVVNDDHASLIALTSILSEENVSSPYTVVPVMSGPAALREVLKNDFAVIFLDVNMPEMDGYETAAAIRMRPGSAHTPIIFVTAYRADELDRSRASLHGACDFLFTPVIPQILRAKAMIFVTLAAKNAQVQQQALNLTARTAELTEANKRLQIEVRERELAQSDSEAKDEFLAMLGHELRNPLSAIRTAGSLLGLPTVAPAVTAKAKQVIERQSRHLTHMVDEILDLSRALSGKLMVHRQHVALADIVRDCLNTPAIEERAQQRKFIVHLAHVETYADRNRIGQVVAQLIENAFKYTEPGATIELSVTVENDDAVFSVRDNGAGITAELLPRLFNTFAQDTVAIDRSAGGLGIGLALAHKITELHGGSLSAHSVGRAQGSTFTLRLPVCDSAVLSHSDAACRT